MSLLGATLTVLLALVEASEVPFWRPAQGGRDEARVEEQARIITRESILGDNPQPLLDALPSWFARSQGGDRGLRQRLAERRRELGRRLGKVYDWEVAEVLRDDRGRIKVKASFFASPRRPERKRPFRGISYVFSRSGGHWRLTWMGFWDPDTGSWDVLGGEEAGSREGTPDADHG